MISNLTPARIKGKISTYPVGGSLRLYSLELARLQRLLDPLIAGGLFWLFFGYEDSRVPAYLHIPSALLVVIFTAVFLHGGKLYLSYRQSSLWTMLGRLTLSWFQVVASLMLIAFTAKVTVSFSRIDFSLWAISSWLMLAVIRVGSHKLLRLYRRRGGNTRNVIFWGSPQSAVSFYEELQSLPYLGLRLVAWFTPSESTATSLAPGMPESAGGLPELRSYLNGNYVDQIHFSSTTEDKVEMEELIKIFGDTCTQVFYIPPWSHPAMNFRVDQLGRLFSIGLWGAEDSSLDRFLKRSFDLVLGGIAVLILSPVFLVVAALVASTSDGPVFFMQERYGLDGRRFKVFKFRTMMVTESGDLSGLQQACRDDPRITTIGRFLRRWSIDELPQLFNVLAGSMSLVGPRPHAVAHNEQYRKLIPGYMQRHLLKPGITGLAQVEGWRGGTPNLDAMANRVEADLRYLKEWSLGLDIKILTKTVLHLRSENAY